MAKQFIENHLILRRRIRFRTILANIILIILGLFFGIILMEGLLRVGAIVQNHDTRQVSVNEENDPLLGHRIMAGSPGYDERGFRNSAALSKVDIVALGDSQTQGSHVPVEDAWPQQLARMSNLIVYNMGIPGYGPAQYYALSTTELLELEPKIAIVAIYLGNDLADAERMIYKPESSAFYAEFQNPTYEHVSSDLQRIWDSQWKLREQ